MLVGAIAQALPGITTNGNSNSNYTPSLGIPLHPVSDIEIAEITKIAENAHRYLQIAFRGYVSLLSSKQA